MLRNNANARRLDFRRLPGPVFDPPLFRGMSAGSFSRTAAGNRAYNARRCSYFELGLPVGKPVGREGATGAFAPQIRPQRSTFLLTNDLNQSGLMIFFDCYSLIV